jgi:hypothetical protein
LDINKATTYDVGNPYRGRLGQAHIYDGVKPVNVSIIGIPTGKSIGFWFEKKLA